MVRSESVGIEGSGRISFRDESGNTTYLSVASTNVDVPTGYLSPKYGGYIESVPV